MKIRATLLRVLPVVAAALLCGPAQATASPRPTEAGQNPFGQPNYSVAEEAPYCTAHACVHWVATTHDAPADLSDRDADGVPDSAEQAGQALEAVYAREVGPPPLGLAWRAPLGDGALGGDARVDLYFEDIANSAYGVAPRDDGQTAAQVHGFLVVDRSYALTSEGSAQRLRDVLAHEFNHLCQYAYDGYFESWLAEATAQWMMDQVEPGFANVRHAVSFWASDTREPLVSRRTSDAPPPKSYGSSVWDLWLAERFGANAVRDAWHAAEAQPTYQSFSPVSFDAALDGRTGPDGAPASFSGEFAKFAAATAEWQLAGSGFGTSAGFPDVERIGSLPATGELATLPLDHTTFALLDVPAREGGSLRLEVTAPDGLRAALALVGRGANGTTMALRELPTGGSGAVTLDGPSAYDRITAVVVNADASRAAERKDASGQWAFARDRQQLTARLVMIGAPPGANEPPAPASTARPPAQTPVVVASPEGIHTPAPAFALDGPRSARLNALRHRRVLWLRLRVMRRVAIRGALQADPVTAHRLRLRGLTVARGAVSSSAGHHRMRLRVSRSTAKRLRRLARGGILTLRLVGTDAAGARTLVQGSLRLR
jgi:hypothetical protein